MKKQYLVIIIITMLLFIAHIDVHAVCYEYTDNTGKTYYSDRVLNAGDLNDPTLNLSKKRVNDSYCSDTKSNDSHSNTQSNDSYTNYSDNTIKCGDGLLDDLPEEIPRIISIIYRVIQVAVPVALAIMGTLDLFKGITTDKEDEIKKGRQTFIKRLIAAALVFFVMIIVKFVVGIAADDSNIMDCAECLIKNNCDSSD